MTSTHRSMVAVTLIILASVVSYAGVVDNAFVLFDDDEIIVRNPDLHRGLSLDSMARAFSLSTVTYWHPLTWLSLMLDHELFGLNPLAYHVENVVLHTLSALVLFAALTQLTRRIELSALVALLFAVHPLNVESVAWAVERKTVLSTLLGLLAVWAYVHYARGPTLVRYLTVFVLMALSLLAKPGLVVLPALLLLLDYWPLGRLAPPVNDGPPSTGRAPLPQASRTRVMLEKVPLLVLAVGVIAITLYSLHSERPDSAVGLALRIENAVVSVVAYLYTAFHPRDLAVFYPFPTAIEGWKVAGAAVAAGSITATAWWTRHRRPYLLVGWCWFLIALFPYLGLVQVRLWPAMADRFAYVPLIGIYIMLVWGFAELVPRRHRVQVVAALAAALVLVLLISATKHQVSHWRDSIRLFSRAVAVSPRSPEMHYNLGTALASEGRFRDAAAALERARDLNPQKSEVRSQLGNVYTMLGRHRQAIDQYQAAIRLDPGNTEALYNLATRLDALGRPAEAAVFYRRFIDVAPPEYQAQRAFVLQRLSRSSR